MPAQNKDDGGWKKFVWNSEKKELLGRTGGSWLKILVFYVIFYGFLTGIFIGTIQALLLTLSDIKPTWQDRVSPPGLSHTPRSDKSELSFNMKDISTFVKYTKAMKDFLEPYGDNKQTDPGLFEDCGDQPMDYKNRWDLESDVGKRMACRFSRTLLGPCDGIEDKEFGFKTGQPCMIVKLNRIVNYRPVPPSNNDTIPEEAHHRAQPFLIPLHCTNKRPEDADKVRLIQYYGIGEGFPLQYYPYYGKRLHPQYLQPLVAIHFVNVSFNEELRIECKVYGGNIKYSEKDRYQGRFDVKLSISDL